MTLSELYDKFLFLVSVPKCVKCGELLDFGERVFCTACLADYEDQKQRVCSRCSKKLGLCSCSNAYLEAHYVRRLIKVYRYNSKILELAGNRVIYSLKQDYRRDVFNFLAAELVSAIKASYDIEGKENDYIITNVPRRLASISKYGYDHGWELAKRVSKLLGIKCIRLLVSKAKRAQKEMLGEARMRNPDIHYARFDEGTVRGKKVILIDDVVTTGASMGISAAMIRGLGVKTILGAAISIAYKDSYARPLRRIK